MFNAAEESSLEASERTVLGRSQPIELLSCELAIKFALTDDVFWFLCESNSSFMSGTKMSVQYEFFFFFYFHTVSKLGKSCILFYFNLSNKFKALTLIRGFIEMNNFMSKAF